MWNNTKEIIETARATGSHFFDPDTMRFFGSRINAALYGGRFFVSSEQHRSMWGSPAWGGARRYTVRVARYVPGDDTLQIDTVGEFGEHATRAAAHRAAQQLADTVTTCSDCGQVVIPGEHTGHRGHFTGAWICHDCGAYCEGGD